MNCNDSINMILLRDSGELSPLLQETLEAHLKTCAPCRASVSALSGMHQVIQSMNGTAMGPSLNVTGVIHAAAQEQALRSRWTISPFWRVAMAAAAVIALCLTGVRFLSPSLPSSQPYTASLHPVATELVPLAALVMGGTETAMDSCYGDSDLAVLADQLLILQGVKTDAREDLTGDPISPEDNRPTTLQWNSSFESLPEIRV